jgi:hypothetical protein
VTCLHVGPFDAGTLRCTGTDDHPAGGHTYVSAGGDLTGDPSDGGDE